MIRVSRPAIGVALTAPVRAALAKRNLAASKLQPGDRKIRTAWANFLASKPKADIVVALDACFRCKCAYCEGVAAQDIEHFYPKTQYPGRMFDWSNFLRGCKNCNNFKLDRFPIAPSNSPLLLDPCSDDPLDYFVWDYQTGAIGVRPEVGYRERAEATVALLHLNMEPLREERRRKLSSVRYLLARVIAETPVTQPTKDRLREELDARTPWLGIVRQLLRRPRGNDARLVKAVLRKLPEIGQWAALWL